MWSIFNKILQLNSQNQALKNLHIDLRKGGFGLSTLGLENDLNSNKRL